MTLADEACPVVFRAGYFRDPDGHVWEVVWNPANIPTDTLGA